MAFEKGKWGSVFEIHFDIFLRNFSNTTILLIMVNPCNGTIEIKIVKILPPSRYSFYLADHNSFIPLACSRPFYYTYQTKTTLPSDHDSFIPLVLSCLSRSVYFKRINSFSNYLNYHCKYSVPLVCLYLIALFIR